MFGGTSPPLAWRSSLWSWALTCWAMLCATCWTHVSAGGGASATLGTAYRTWPRQFGGAKCGTQYPVWCGGIVVVTAQTILQTGYILLPSCTSGTGGEGIPVHGSAGDQRPDGRFRYRPGGCTSH